MIEEVAVIVNPDRFVQEKRFHRRSSLPIFVPRGQGTNKRNYLCDACLYGKHECSNHKCPCDCRHVN